MSIAFYNLCYWHFMERKPDFLTGHALISRLKAYYTLLPKGYMDTLVGMAIADSTGNPPIMERGKGYSPRRLAIKKADDSV
jgi:hypothetical protein